MTWLLGLAIAGPLVVPTPGDGHAYHPVWSADGASLAFEVNRYAGDVELFVAAVDEARIGTVAPVVLPGATSAFGASTRVAVNPVWAPDGHLVFVGTHASGRTRLFDRDGAGRVRELVPLDQLPGDLSFPSTHDGGLIFVADATGSGDLRVRDRKGKLRRLMTTPEAEAFPISSGDGSRLLYSRKVQGAEDVFELSLVRGTETTRASGPGDQTRPVFAEGGRVLYFDGGQRRDQWDLVASGEGRPVTLARDVRLPLRARPAVSPDGNWVAWTSADPAGPGVVRISRVDGKRTVEIPTTFVAVGEPSLGQRGARTWLAFTALPSAGATWRFLAVLDVTDRLTR